MSRSSIRMITAKYDGRCRDCGCVLHAGDRIAYDFDTAEALCTACGDVREREYKRESED